MDIIGMQEQVCGASVVAQVIGPHADATTSANFYMYIYKVVLCQKRHSHDWGACPYAHEKEKARRRDPQTCKYSSCICPNASKGECPNGLNCPYAHTLFEYWLHPARFRTQMCRSGPNCKRALCFFAHSAAELRQPTKPIPSNESLSNGALPPLSASAVVRTVLGPKPQCGRYSESAAAFGSAGDLVAWPLAVDDRSCSSLASSCSLVTPGGSSVLPMTAGNAAATIVSCPGPDVYFGNQLPVTSCSSAASNLMVLHPGIDAMVAPAANPASLAMVQQLQQEVALNQARLQELELALQQENIRAALAGVEQQSVMTTMAMSNMVDVGIAETMGTAATSLGRMSAAPLPLPVSCNASLAAPPRISLFN